MSALYDNDHDFAKAVRTKLDVPTNDAAMEAIGELFEIAQASVERDLQQTAPVDEVAEALSPRGPLGAPDDMTPNPPEALGGEPHGHKVDPALFPE